MTSRRTARQKEPNTPYVKAKTKQNKNKTHEWREKKTHHQEKKKNKAAKQKKAQKKANDQRENRVRSFGKKEMRERSSDKQEGAKNTRTETQVWPGFKDALQVNNQPFPAF